MSYALNSQACLVILASLFIKIPFILWSLFYTECQCIWFESIPNQVWSYIHQMIKKIVDFAFW